VGPQRPHVKKMGWKSSTIIEYTLLNDHEKLFGSYSHNTFGPSSILLHLLGKGISVRVSQSPYGGWGMGSNITTMTEVLCLYDAYKHTALYELRRTRFSSWFQRVQLRTLDYRYVFKCYFLFKRILNTRAVYLCLNPTCMCSIVHPSSSFEELCTVYLPC
jgi:hypothetical protein